MPSPIRATLPLTEEEISLLLSALNMTLFDIGAYYERAANLESTKPEHLAEVRARIEALQAVYARLAAHL